MYSLSSRVSIVLELSAFAAAFNIDLPQPTQTLKDYSADGFTPKPTADPLIELRKRDSPSSVCAYLSGDPSAPYTCGSGGVCGYNMGLSWFGCCDGESGGSVTGCPVITGCVPYTSIDACASNSVCASDTMLIACTESATPYCAAGALTAGTDTLVHFICDTTSYVLDFELTAAGGAASSVFDATTSTDDFESTTTGEFGSTSIDDSATTTSADDSSSTVGVVLTKIVSASAKGSSTSGAVTTGTPTSSKTGGVNLLGTLGGKSTAGTATSTGGAAVRTGAAVMGAAEGVAGLILLLA
ncbi:uncharacterized protein BDZ99DRAFT_577076 [Mytilinidion resinicola]|uniref:Osmotin, thaumatin-like protein n=1 Tax=Mytilinidion resinicola TaxID=574789 RepID=A0A6A6Y0L7_9PEZI|nr:uncharacterized protein BDZ99DRAFT_577076 [Mytilinidion resinicola]KAF2802098.1 hypothetical protein BDZ99DRAFT_577076 [Mytilinidion resinicola]